MLQARAAAPEAPGPMTAAEFPGLFPAWSTPVIADACLRVGVPLRIGPPRLRPLREGQRAAGPALPVRHHGSVDVFLEAMATAQPGGVVVIDNGARLDEGCIGDLTALEARAAGLAGLVVWGVHRDHAELRAIDLPVFSLGTCPAGPVRLDPREPETFVSARLGAAVATADDWVFADDDGVVLVAQAVLAGVVRAGCALWEAERAQADAVRAGRRLREQLQLEAYRAKRARDPAVTFRHHLREIRGAIEE